MLATPPAAAMGTRSPVPTLRLGWIAALALFALLGENLCADHDALIADVHTGSRDQSFNLRLALAAKRAEEINLRRFRRFGRILHMRSQTASNLGRDAATSAYSRQICRSGKQPGPSTR
jgi:hypothetical protein